MASYTFETTDDVRDYEHLKDKGGHTLSDGSICINPKHKKYRK